MTFNLTLWLANENRSRDLSPKIRSRGNLCGVPREQKFGRIRCQYKLHHSNQVEQFNANAAFGFTVGFAFVFALSIKGPLVHYPWRAAKFRFMISALERRLSMEGSLSCYTCFQTGPVSSEESSQTTRKGMRRTSSNPDPHNSWKYETRLNFWSRRESVDDIEMFCTSLSL
jgi:hypothetical protein